MGAAAGAVAARASVDGPLANGISLATAAAIDADRGPKAGRRPGHGAPSNGECARDPAHAPSSAIADTTKTPGGAAGPTPGTVSPAGAGRSAARSNTRGGGRAGARRAFGARDRPGPAQHRLPGRDDRPTDEAPGRCGADRPWLPGAAERNGHHERPRDLQANARDSRLAPPPYGGPGRRRAVPGHRRWQRPGRADSADR